MSLEKLNQLIDEASEERMAEMFSKAALELSDEQINTVSFCFWLVYMAESDLNAAISESWGNATLDNTPEARAELLHVLQQFIPGKKELDPDNLEYFNDKILLYEGLVGSDVRSQLFRKLKAIRNDISHNRIDTLTYNEQSLNLINVKKQLARDYFTTALAEKDLSKSPFLNSLNEEELELIEGRFPSLKR